MIESPLIDSPFSLVICFDGVCCLWREGVEQKTVCRNAREKTQNWLNTFTATQIHSNSYYLSSTITFSIVILYFISLSLFLSLFYLSFPCLRKYWGREIAKVYNLICVFFFSFLDSNFMVSFLSRRPPPPPPPPPSSSSSLENYYI